MPARFRRFQPKTVAGGAGVTPPSLVDSQSTVFNTTTTPKTLGVSPAVNDILVVCALGAEFSGTHITVSGGGLTWALQQQNTNNSYTQHNVWTAVCDSTTPFNISCGNAANVPWGFNFTQWRGSSGVGASNKANAASGQPSVGLTTLFDNSAVVYSNGDWTPATGSVTYRQINSASPTERANFQNASIGAFYVATYADAGTAGAKTAGMTAPAGQKYINVAVEIRGT